MTPFLQLVAEDLRRKNGNDLSRVAVVFPNKRASLFLNEYLIRTTGGNETVWAPQYLTISDLFHRLSTLTIADPIEAICRLHRLYVGLTGSEDRLDFFYGWGERLMADFDDVDKNRADARRLFRNLSEIKQLDNVNYVDSDKERALQSFFADFSLNNNTRLRQRFLRLWEVLYPLYTQLNEELAADGLAYEGALYRRAIEELETGRTELPGNISTYVFVGFNVLDRVEESLFSLLQQRGKALFYWDYDVAYMSQSSSVNEAGIFLRANIEKFPNQLPSSCFDNLFSTEEKNIEFVSAPTENAQARSAAQWLREHITEDEKRTAVVLCNENLLQPLLHSLPPEVKEVNVTKGYPLHHTRPYRLLEHMMDEHKPEKDNATWIAECIEAIKLKAQAVARQPDSLDKTLETEACFRAYVILSRFARLVREKGMQVEPTTLHKLLRQVMHQASIPFHGEPAAGLQVMGILETRGLDFENILLLSVNEGNLPRRTMDNSFIPNVLRREFGLTTERHRNAVYAYYFYRLIQRAQHVRLTFNNSTSGGASGEMSRFMKQLLIESPLPIVHHAITASVVAPERHSRPLLKPMTMVEQMTKLSPSAINSYLRCQLQFYFEYVARLKAPQLETGIIAPNVFGNVFHKTAELFYKKMAQKADGRITGQLLQSYMAKEHRAFLQDIVKQAMLMEDAGNSKVVMGIILRYMNNLIKHDSRLGQFRLFDTERKMGTDLQIPLHNGSVKTIRIEGVIDRMDILNEGMDNEFLRILDYKTGSDTESTDSIEKLFIPSKQRPHYILQTFIYALFMTDKTKMPIQPALFFVHRAASEDYTATISYKKQQLLDFRPLAVEFRTQLEKLIAEMLDMSRPFEPTKLSGVCEKCPFRDICIV